MPKEEDLHGSARALIRLQEIYELDISKLTKGQMEYKGKKFQTMARLSAQVKLVHLEIRFYISRKIYFGKVLGAEVF